MLFMLKVMPKTCRSHSQYLLILLLTLNIIFLLGGMMLLMLNRFNKPVNDTVFIIDLGRYFR